MSDHHRTDKSHADRSSQVGRPKVQHITGKKTTGKWVDAPAVEAPIADVAHEALRLRLEHVQRMLPLAAYHHAEDLEHVHRLRVSCRRAAAALAAFRPLFDDKVKPLRRWLRRMRGAAGPARDVDVLLAALQNESATGAKRLRYLTKPFQQRREKLQRRMVNVAVQAVGKSQAGPLPQAIATCLLTIPPGKQLDSEPFGTFARQRLSASAGEVLRLGEELRPACETAGYQASLPSIDQMHELRIAVKRFRYSIELFHGAFPAPLRHTIYPRVEEMQKRLGTLNDHATIQKQYQWLMARDLPGDRVVDLAARIVQQYEAVLDSRLDFLLWWTPEEAATLRSELDLLLSSPSIYHSTAE